MSSYIVNNQTISHFLKGLKSMKIEDLEKTDSLQKFGQELLDMNYNAYGQRYNDFSTPHTYSFELVHTNSIQAYKCGRCLWYQCMEGDVPESELFLKLEELLNRMAAHIVQKLPEYDEAGWGVD